MLRKSILVSTPQLVRRHYFLNCGKTSHLCWSCNLIHTSQRLALRFPSSQYPLPKLVDWLKPKLMFSRLPNSCRKLQATNPDLQAKSKTFGKSSTQSVHQPESEQSALHLPSQNQLEPRSLLELLNSFWRLSLRTSTANACNTCRGVNWSWSTCAILSRAKSSSDVTWWT